MGALEESIQLNLELKELIEKLILRIDNLNKPDSSWIDVPWKRRCI